MLVIGLIIIGVLLRLLPHAPNFTPVGAIALFGGVYLRKKYALIIPLASMIISDLIIGIHEVVLFTWGSFILIVFLGFWIKKQKNIARVTIASLSSSLFFFLITNFGVWLAGWYPHTLKGLLNCYIMAIPFLRNFTMATIIYVVIFFTTYELVARLVKNTKFSRALLIN